MMKKLLIVLAFASVSLTTMAQDNDATLKYSVASNSFWSNWFIQGGVQWDAFYSSSEHGKHLSHSPFKDFRSNPQLSVGVGKWFTPGLGLRTKLTGIWGKADHTSFHYWAVQEHVMFNLSNMLCGYNPDRVYNFIPLAGAVFARNCSNHHYQMGLTFGLLNKFNLSRKVALNLELGWNRLENDFFSLAGSPDNGRRGWDSHDNVLYAEVGVTYNLGRATWDKTPDVDALKALSQAQIDALNAQLNDANTENGRLKRLLAEKKEPTSLTVKELVSTPVSVFFDLDKYNIASRKDLVDVEEVAKYAKANGTSLVVTGYADSATGKPDHNQWLSEKRAETVANELVNMGMSRDKIITEAKGGVLDLSPIQFNRRATVQVKD